MRILLLITLLLVSSFANAAYYVKNGGNDSNTGLSDAQAWATVSKVNSFTFSASDDVYFKVGSTWNEALIVDWSGTSGDRAIIGAYYMDGTETTGVSTGGVKPILNGTYPTVKVWDAAPSNGAAVPSYLWDGLITLSAASYVTITNIKLTNSAGFGIVIEGGHDNIVDSIDSYIAAEANTTVKNSSYNNLIKNSTMQYCGMLDKEFPSLSGTHPGCNAFVNSYKNVFENNVVTSAWGEGASNWGANAYNNIFKDNIISAYAVGIYLGYSHDNIVENNIVIGDPSGNFDRTSGYVGSGIETTGETGASLRNIIRNNLVAGTHACFLIDLWPDIVTAGGKSSGKFIGNTCVGNRYPLVSYSRASDYIHATENYEIANNIFYDSDLGCEMATSSYYNLHNNVWGDGQPADTDCRGTNDINSAPTLNTTSDFRLFGPLNIPTATDFQMVTTSAGENVGSDLSATETLLTINDTNYPLRVSTANAVSANTLSVDYTYAARANPPDIGALEVGSSPAPGTPLAAPFYMNAGGGVYSGTYSWVAEDYDTHVGGYTGTYGGATAGAIDSAIHQTVVGASTSLNWAIPTSETLIDVYVYISEQYWGVSSGTCTVSGGHRVIDIYIEGVLVGDEVDYCQLAGAANTEIVLYYLNQTVSDGYLNISVTGGTGGDDHQPEIMGIGFTDPLGAGTLTINNPTPVVTLLNNYPAKNSFSALTQCGATTTSGSITVTGLDCTNLTSGTLASIGSGTLEHTPANANAGAIGSCVVTLSDINGSGACTASITLTTAATIAPLNAIYSYYKTGENTYARVLVASATGLCYTIYKSGREHTSLTESYSPSSCNGTTDANGKFSFSNEWLVSGQRYTVYLNSPNLMTISGHKIVGFATELPPVIAQ